MAAPSPITVSLKLLIDPKSKRLLFAEAGKDFVDFLFSIMSLPAGTMIRLLGKRYGMRGSIRNIYESIENLGVSYIQSAEDKEILLKPQAFNYGTYVPKLFPSMQPPTHTNFYRCTNNSEHCRKYMANDQSRCPNCRSIMTGNFTFVNFPNKSGTEGGFVKEAVTYMIMDDLVVKPMSGTKSIISLLNKFKVKDAGDVEEKVIAVGVTEGVELLRASMYSETVLTSVFLEQEYMLLP